MRLLWRPVLALCMAWLFVACASDSDDPTADDSPMYAEVTGALAGSDGMALAEVAVQLVSDVQTLETVSDDDGAFTFAEVPVPRAWALTADAAGYEPFERAVAGLQAGETREVTVTLIAIVVDEPNDPEDNVPEVESGSEVGQLAPDFTLPDINGDLVTLSSYRGTSHVLVAFHRGVF